MYRTEYNYHFSIIIVFLNLSGYLNRIVSDQSGDIHELIAQNSVCTDPRRFHRERSALNLTERRSRISGEDQGLNLSEMSIRWTILRIDHENINFHPYEVYFFIWEFAGRSGAKEIPVRAPQKKYVCKPYNLRSAVNEFPRDGDRLRQRVRLR
jgi:hypothetical protein